MFSQYVSALKAALSVGALAAILLIGGCKDTVRNESATELLEQGWKYYRLAEYNLALECFSAAAEKSESKSETQLQAIYAQASTWNLRRPGEDLQKAEQLYRKLLDASPKHDLAGWSMLALARMKHTAVSCSMDLDREPDYSDTYKAYQECIDKFPTHPAAEEALLFQQMTLISSFNPEKTARAAETLAKYLAEHPKSSYCSEAHGLLAYAYDTLKRPDKKLDAQIKSCELQEVDPQNPGADKAIIWWNIATTAEFDAGDFETARKYYRLLIDTYPNDLRLYGAKQALKRMDELEAKLRAEVSK